MSRLHTAPLEDFIARVKAADAKRTPMVNLPLQDAKALSASLAQVLAKLTGMQEEMIEVLKSAQSSQELNVEMDGGDFK